MRKIKIVLVLLALVAALGAAQVNALGTDSKQVQMSGRTVSVKDNFFTPKNKRISRRSSIRWKWRGRNVHNVTFTRVPRGASKRGAGNRTRGTFRRSFRKRGTYRYVCTIHRAEGMRGTVKVR